MAFSDFFFLHKSDRQVLLVFLLLVVVMTSGIFVLDLFEGETTDDVAAMPEREKATVSNILLPVTDDPTTVVTRRKERFPFDPNTADSSQLLRLGLEPWQVRNIYKYRAAGGIYRQKEDFARLYGLTLKEYRELEPYIRISADYQPAERFVKATPEVRDTARYPHKLADGMTIDLSLADTAQLKRVPGIGSHFARAIVHYRQRLGGYVSIDQLSEIDGFPAEAKSYFTIGHDSVVRLNLNRLSVNELRHHPYLNYYQARTIVDYRRQHGPLKSLDDLRLLRDFPAETLQRLQPYVEF